MPRLIDFGSPYGTVSFPDEATDDQIVSHYELIKESDRPRALQAARLSLQGALQGVEQQQPSLEKYALRSGLALGEQTAGAAKQAVGNITRGLADVFSIPKSDLQVSPDTSNPELPVNIMREAGRSLSEEGRVQRQQASELGESIGGGVGPAIAESLAGTAGISATALPAAVFGLGPVAVAAAIQSYGLNLSDFKDTLQQRNPNLTEDEAFKQAQVPAVLTAIATGVLTRGFGGVERFIEKIANEGIGQVGVKALLREAFKSAALEFPEEYGDQLAQGFTEKAFINPDKPIGEIFNEAGLAGLSGFALGGLTTGAIASPAAVANAVTEPSRMRRGTARRQAVIANEVEQGNLLPERTPNTSTIGTVTQTPSPQEAPVQETDGGVRLRNPPENGVEAQAGAPLTPAVTPQSSMVQFVVNQVTANWQAPPTIKVVNTSEEFPADVKAAAAKAGFQLNETPAVKAQDGTVWMASNLINDEDHAKRLLLHEAVGHFGVESIFGAPEQFNEFMQGVSDRHADTDLGNQIRALYGNDPTTVGREIVAKLAENPAQDPTLWQNIVATVRDWARRVFNLEVSDNDIKVLLSRGRRAVEQGGATAGRAGVGAEPSTTFASEENLPDAAVVYKGFQPGFGSIKGFDLYNLTDTLASSLVKGSTVTEAALVKAGFKVPAAEKIKAQQGRPPGDTSFAVERPQTPQFFQTREQVEAAVNNPGISPFQQQQARDLAAVQSSMSPDNIVGWIMGSPVDDADAFAQRKLAYIENRRYLDLMQRSLVSMPEGTEEERRAKEVAGAQILGHYGVDRATERQINYDLESDQPLMAKAVSKLGKLTNAQIKSNFLTALFNRLTSDYRQYLINLNAAAPANENIQAQYRQRLADAERMLNDQAASPIAVQRALSAIASQVPLNLLTANSSNDAIISWAMTSDVLQGIVGSDIRNWLLVDGGNGEPALRGYARLIPDLTSLRDVLQNQNLLAQDIEDFEKWFRPSGKTGKVSAKQFAEAYSKFRAGRDRAVKLAASMENEIDGLDTRIRGNTIARNRIQSMMSDLGYVSTVKEAAKRAHVVVRALYDSQDNKTGLIERDKTVGRWRLTGPTTGTEYVVDLYPSSSQEAVNRGALMAYITEARLFAQVNAQTDPLLADEYNNLADYIEKYLVHPSLDPGQGFTQEPWMQIPGTSIRITTDPFDMWSAATGPLFRTIRDVLERIGGRATRQAVLDGHELDLVMRKIEGINANPIFGYAAQTQAVLKALNSHQWSTDQFARWDEDVAERVLASGQNNLGPIYEVGDIVVGSGVELTNEDIAALKLMKQWEDAVLATAPKHIQDRLGDLGIVRKASGSGRYTMARIAAPWTKKFMLSWADATDDSAKLKVLSSDENFRRVVMGYIGEFNPEFSKMNPASPNKSTLFDILRRIAITEKQGVQSFNNLNDVLDFIANEMVNRNLSPDYTTARKSAQETLLSDIKGFVTAFENNVINYKSTETYGGVPPAVVQMASANNSFTTPRGLLYAPSTFYSYSTASDGRRLQHVGSLRSLLNLKLLQSGREARAALEKKKSEMDERIQKLSRTGLKQRTARKRVIRQSEQERKASEIRYDYKELLAALSSLEKVFNSLERFEASTADHYEHAGVAALNNVFGTIKAFLLSSTQAITTNYWGGTLLGPAIFHWQTGQYLKSLQDVVPAPHLWKTVLSKVSDMVASNSAMAKLLKMHAPLWTSLAENIVKASSDWRRIQQVAEQTGMVSPYNLRKINANKKALKGSAGRLETDDPHMLMEWTNAMMSAPGIRHVTEAFKATTPRFFDNLINYSLVASFERDMDFLAKNGWTAFQAREASAGTADWKDMSNPSNVLLPGDLGLKTFKGLERYQQLFAPLGSLDRVLLDYYERTKGLTPEQRESEPLIQNNDDYGALALEYAAITNVATETRRSYALKGKGSDGLWRNIIGTFMGWVTNMTKQFSKAMQSHSRDPKRVTIWRNMLGLATIILLLSGVGAWNWEFGDELTKRLYKQSSARIQIGNIKDVETGALYFVQALVNTVPVFGPMMGNLAGLAFTGRGQPFDPASLMPAVGFALGTYNTVKRIVQTGDVVLPMADWSRQWMPFTKIAINRAPVIQGIVDQQNAVRSLNASAPPGTEIKWGQRGGGDIRYSPANDEIMKLISSAYDVAARGGSMEAVQKRLADAVAVYVSQGKTQEEAVKSVASALSSKEPIRILTGREMTEDEERKWVSRMTPEQKADYDRAIKAWGVLGEVTGKNMDMVAAPKLVGGGGGGRGGGYGSASSSPITGLRTRRSTSRRGGLAGMGGQRRSGLRSVSRRRGGPSVSRRRSSLGSRRRLRHSLA